MSSNLSAVRAELARVYDRFRYAPQNRKALDAWVAYLRHLVAITRLATNILPFARYAHA